MIAGGVAALAVAGAAIAAASFLGGGGAQPEDDLSAGALAFAKVDLDPAAGQKLAVYRLAQRFPSTGEKVKSEDSVKDELLSALFGSNPDVDYDRDVAPWIGDRVGIAAVPGTGAGPEPLAAIAYTDRAGARPRCADCKKMTTRRSSASETRPTTSCSARPRRRSMRLSAASRCWPTPRRGAPELTSTPIGDGAGSGMVQRLPESTVAALSLTNLGAGLAELFDTLYADGGEDPLGIVARAEDLGVSLPDDLRTLLGEESLAAVVGAEELGLRTRSDDVEHRGTPDSCSRSASPAPGPPVAAPSACD